MKNQTFVGYSTLEEWLRAYRALAGPALAPVQSLGLVRPQNGSHNLTYRHYSQWVSFVAEQQVHYVSIPWGATVHLGDVEFSERNPAVRSRAETGGALVDEWLRRQGLPVYAAAVATPKDLVLLDGWAGCLQWDDQAKAFALMAAATPVAAERP